MRNFRAGSRGGNARGSCADVVVTIEQKGLGRGSTEAGRATGSSRRPDTGDAVSSGTSMAISAVGRRVRRLIAIMTSGALTVVAESGVGMVMMGMGRQVIVEMAVMMADAAVFFVVVWIVNGRLVLQKKRVVDDRGK